MAGDLTRLLNRKDDSQYGLTLVSAGESEHMVGWAIGVRGARRRLETVAGDRDLIASGLGANQALYTLRTDSQGRHHAPIQAMSHGDQPSSTSDTAAATSAGPVTVASLDPVAAAKPIAS